MAEQNERSQLPPGWECRYDVGSGRPYYINHFNKSTSWEDPRVRYWQYAQYTQAQNSITPSPVATNSMIPESIPMQSVGGGGGYLVYAGAHRAPQVYPTPSPYHNPQPAFLPPSSQEFKTSVSSRSVSAMTNRLGGMTIGSPPTPVRVLESSLTQNSDTELQVARINAMFPTVTDTHIRLLLKKYLKNVFPKVDETILLEILEQSENNVQKASEKLIELGYEKRNPTAPSRSSLKKDGEQAPQEIPAPTPPPRMKSLEEKNKIKARLMEKYQSVPDRVITLAMDSVDYDEERAAHILDIMVAEEADQTPLRTSSGHSSRSEERRGSPPVTEAIKLTASPIKKIVKDSDAEKSKRSKNKNEIPKVSRGTSTTEDKKYKSPYLTKTVGANPDLPKGANNQLLLPDYVPWAGPDPTLTFDSLIKKSSAVGHDPTLVTGNCHKITCGADPKLRKGPLRALAQGSIYSQRNAANIESRGK